MRLILDEGTLSMNAARKIPYDARSASRPRGPGRPTPLDEMTDALSGEIAHCAALAAEKATVLESIGAQAFAVTGEIFRGAGSTDLLRRSHGIRGLVLHALTALTELQNIAGRLETLAALRGVATDSSHVPTGRIM